MRAPLLLPLLVGGCLVDNPRYDGPGGGATGTGSAGATGTGLTGGASSSGASGASDQSSGGSGGTTAGGTSGAPDGKFACDETDTALVACYTFEEFANGNVIADESATGNDLATKGCMLSAGVHGSGILMTATSEAVAADAPSLQYSGQKSWEMWVRPDVIPPADDKPVRLLSKPNSMDLSIRPGGALRCSTPRADAEGSLAVVETWTHVACVDDGSEVLLYVDGALVAAAGGTVGVTDPLGDLALGNQSPDLDQPFVGTIDNVRISTVARTAADICESAGSC